MPKWKPTKEDRLGTMYDRFYSRVPPGMSTEDYQIWMRWRGMIPGDVIQVYFNVRLGWGAEAPDGMSDDMIRGWWYNTAKRADVVLEYEHKVDIVELRNDASSSAIGRLMQYQMLWYTDPPLNKPVELVLVSDREDQDVAMLCAQEHIVYVVV